MNEYSSGKTCAPDRAKSFDGTCYSLEALKKIAKAYNRTHQQKIKISDDKKALWLDIKSKIGSKCQSEWCWIEQEFSENLESRILNGTFKPTIPNGKYEWLSNDDIDFVLKQYENFDQRFHYYDAIPIDYKNRVSLKRDIERGKTKWGFVFNTGKSSSKGEHWVGLYMEIFEINGLRFGTIDYFDSYGIPPPKEIRQFIQYLLKQAQKQGYNTALNVNRYRHQFKNSECGVYVIHFIVNRLLGIPFTEVTRNVIHDEKMNQFRKQYFRPRKNLKVQTAK